MMDSFLLIGQSNMAGRGYAREVPPIINEHIKMLRNGRWQMMFEPVNFDHPGAAIGLSAAFASAWCLENPRQEIGLIPCAEGGSSLDDWAAGGELFDHAVFQARLAQRTSSLSGILWHQGESDCNEARAAQYGPKLHAIMTGLRQQLNVPDIPLVTGGLGDFLTEGIYGQYFESYPLINKALQDYAQANTNCYFVTAKGLSANADGVHFNAISQRRFGIRYYHAYRDLKHIFEPPGNEKQLLSAIHNRQNSQAEKMKMLELSFVTGQIPPAAFLTGLAQLDQQI